jgi:hypothetical protein
MSHLPERSLLLTAETLLLTEQASKTLHPLVAAELAHHILPNMLRVRLCEPLSNT